MNTCQACGGHLPPLRSRGRPRKWCSGACRAWGRRYPGKLRVARISLPTQSCVQCGTSFKPQRSEAKFCSLACVGAASRRKPARCAESDCTFVSGPDGRLTRGLCRSHYKKAYGADWSQGNPDARKARERAKTHRRRSATRLSDVTTAYERKLRAAAKRCPICRVKLIDEPYRAASKELDHIVPLGIGGTHTVGNVRIICRDCNLRRPKDGSDYVGPVSLFALEVA